MSTPQQRKYLLQLIGQACTDGARLARACAQIGLSERTIQRWQHPDGQGGDRRESGLHERAEPPNKLSALERAQAMALLNGQAFKDLPPSQIVPRLADQGRYIASEAGPLPVAAPSRADDAPSARTCASKAQQAACLDGQRSRPNLLLGHHLPAHAGAWQLLLPVPVCRSVQPQNSGLASL